MLTLVLNRHHKQRECGEHMDRNMEQSCTFVREQTVYTVRPSNSRHGEKYQEEKTKYAAKVKAYRAYTNIFKTFSGTKWVDIFQSVYSNYYRLESSRC